MSDCKDTPEVEDYFNNAQSYDFNKHSYTYRNYKSSVHQKQTKLKVEPSIDFIDQSIFIKPLW